MKIIVVRAEHQELIEGNYPCILNEGYYLVPSDCYDELAEEGISFMVRDIKDLY